MSNAEQIWDLESIFPGGSSSPELQMQLEAVRTQIAALQAQVEALTSGLTLEQLKTLVHDMQDVQINLGQCRAFVSCLTAQNVRDNKAKLLQGDLGYKAYMAEAMFGVTHNFQVPVPCADQGFYDMILLNLF